MRRAPVAFALVLAAGCQPAASPPPAAPRTPRSSTTAGPFVLDVFDEGSEGWEGTLVRVRLVGPGRVRVLGSPAIAPVGEIAAGARAGEVFVAVNGWLLRSEGEPLGLIRAGGRDLHPLGPGGGSGVLTVGADGLRVVHTPDYDPARVEDALQSVDRLVSGGRSLVAPGPRRAARSAIALDAEGRPSLFVAFDVSSVAEGATEDLMPLTLAAGRRGPTLSEMADLLRRPVAGGGAGAVEALGLDGGLSTALLVKLPGRTLRVEGVRGTRSAVLLTPER